MKDINSLFSDKTEYDFDKVSTSLVDILFRELQNVDFLLANYRHDIDTDRVYERLSNIRYYTKILRKHVSRLDNLKNGKPIKNS